MKNVMCFVTILVVLLSLSSCVSTPTKSANGNFDLTVAPLAEGETQVYPRIYVDKKFIGNATPDKPVLYLKRGEHTIKVELDGYETWEEEVYLLGEPNMQMVHVQLKKLP